MRGLRQCSVSLNLTADAFIKSLKAFIIQIGQAHKYSLRNDNTAANYNRHATCQSRGVLAGRLKHRKANSTRRNLRLSVDSTADRRKSSGHRRNREVVMPAAKLKAKPRSAKAVNAKAPGSRRQMARAAATPGKPGGTAH